MERLFLYGRRSGARSGPLAAAALACWLLLAPAGLARGEETPTAPESAPAASAAPARTIIRFLTDSDYPPFDYVDEEGTLTGFNIDVARALCLELEVACDIQTRDWSGLLPALARGEADAVIASIAINPRTLRDADFTDRYYATPARFVTRKDAEPIEISPEGLESRRIAVVKGTAHEAYAQAFFRDSQIVSFETHEAAREALVGSSVDVLFGDGVGLMLWITGTLANGCCEFRGGPYYDDRYFGDGVGIAVRKGDETLRSQLNRAIAKLRAGGRFEELLLRYFPLKVF